MSASHHGRTRKRDDRFRGVVGAVVVACLALALTAGAVASGSNVAKVPVKPPTGIHQRCFEYGIPRSVISTKLLGNGDYRRGQSPSPTWLTGFHAIRPIASPAERPKATAQFRMWRTGRAVSPPRIQASGREPTRRREAWRQHCRPDNRMSRTGPPPARDTLWRTARGNG